MVSDYLHLFCENLHEAFLPTSCFSNHVKEKITPPGTPSVPVLCVYHFHFKWTFVRREQKNLVWIPICTVCLFGHVGVCRKFCELQCKRHTRVLVTLICVYWSLSLPHACICLSHAHPQERRLEFIRYPFLLPRVDCTVLFTLVTLRYETSCVFKKNVLHASLLAAVYRVKIN